MLQKVVESKWIKPAFEAYRNNLEIANQTRQRTPGGPSVLAGAGGGAAELVVSLRQQKLLSTQPGDRPFHKLVCRYGLTSNILPANGEFPNNQQ